MDEKQSEQYEKRKVCPHGRRATDWSAFVKIGGAIAAALLTIVTSLTTYVEGTKERDELQVARAAATRAEMKAIRNQLDEILEYKNGKSSK